MSSSLVQIEGVPPLRQSTQETMACPRFYATAMIEGRSQPGGMDAARGTEIHRTMAAYLSHCALHQVSADMEAFERFSRGAGPQAARILAGLRDGFEVDHAHLFATEITLSLDQHFAPTDLPGEMQGIVPDSELPPHYQGTLDGVYLFYEAAKVRVDDFKSHARPFLPDDKPQGKQYAAMAFLYFPWAMEVTFRLVFVRYQRLTREVTYTRDQLPSLLEALQSARERQVKIHEDYQAGRDIPALAGNHCNYCPLLTNAQCPIAQFNPHLQYTPAERLNFNLWYAAFSRANNAAMAAYIDATGKPIILKDFNGRSYVYGMEERQSEVYPVFQFGADGMVMRRKAIPLLPIIDLLYDYAHDNPGDMNWMKHLTISSTSLKRYLKTNKRAFLDQAIEDTSEKVTRVKLQVSKPLDAADLPDDDEEWEESEL